MMKLIAFALCLMASTAFGQQPTPSQTAIQIDNVINQWAQTIEALQRENAELKKQLEDAKAAKVEEKK